jgi:RHS repeat-associated protein
VRARRGNNAQSYQYTYDANGNLKTATDSYAKTTTYAYDALNRLSTSTDPLQGIASFTYDAADRLKSVKDPHNITTTYQRDGFGQLWKEISPDRGTTAYHYLANGLVDTITRGNGVQTAYQFDGRGRPTQLTAGGQSETFAYDLCTNGIGRLCTATAPGTTVSYTYERDGRVRSRKDQITLAGAQTTYTTSYAYDPIGRLSKLTYPNGEAATYAYSTGQPSALTMTVGGVAKNMVTGASFEPSGRLSGYAHGNGLVRDYAFDLDGRYSGITSKNGAAAVQSLSYLYDQNDRITTITNPLPNYGETFGYDALSRLTGATGWGYTYDGNANRLTLSPNSSVYTYVPGTNRLASVSNVFIAPDGAIVVGDPPVPDYISNFTHDGAGNVTKWDFPSVPLTVSYTYDPFNRMSAVLDTTSGSTPLGQYGYNAFGERTNKRDLTHAHNYAFIYGEGHELIGEHEDAVWTNYVWFAGELVGMTRAGAIYQIDNDHLGRPELITNANKVIVWQSNNDPFGGMTTTTNTLGEFNIGFPGQYFDAESNYWYNMNRYYVAALGRYLQPDPAGLAGGLNPYAYVSSNPASSVDALGLAAYPADFVGPLQAGDCYSLVPTAPPGVSVNDNIAESSLHSNPLWFKAQVQNRGLWDYKQQGSIYENFGNFNYGATGISFGFGFSERTLLREAGRAQQAAGTSMPEWGDPGSRLNPWGGSGSFGDDPVDQMWIQRGISYSQNGERDACPCGN